MSMLDLPDLVGSSASPESHQLNGEWPLVFWGSLEIPLLSLEWPLVWPALTLVTSCDPPSLSGSDEITLEKCHKERNNLQIHAVGNIPSLEFRA